MTYSLIDDWVQDFYDEHDYNEKDVLVEVFPQVSIKDGKIKNIPVTVIREKNCEVVDVYFEEQYQYSVYDANDKFLRDLKNHELQPTEETYQE